MDLHLCTILGCMSVQLCRYSSVPGLRECNLLYILVDISAPASPPNRMSTCVECQNTSFTARQVPFRYAKWNRFIPSISSLALRTFWEISHWNQCGFLPCKGVIWALCLNKVCLLLLFCGGSRVIKRTLYPATNV